MGSLLIKLGVNEAINVDKEEQKEEEEEEEEKKDEDVIIKRSNNKKKIFTKRDDNLYYAPMAQSRFAMNQRVICKKLSLDIDKILNIYIIGSRVWGSGKSKSDWDIIMVYDEDIDTKNIFKSIDNIDAYILDKKKWNQQLKNHKFLLWLTLFLPASA